MKIWIAIPTIAALLLAGSVHAATDDGDDSDLMNEAFMEQMESMHEQMEQLRATDDPDTRRELMQAHMESMHQAMTGMRGMMMGGAMHGGSEMGRNRWERTDDGDCYRKADSAVHQMRQRQRHMAERMERMEGRMEGGTAMMDGMQERMGMMQQMMEQMLGQQEQMMRGSMMGEGN